MNGQGATIEYGMFIQSVFDFLIVAACIFGLVKAINRVKSKLDPAKNGPPKSEVLLTEIRDLLAAQRAVAPPTS